MARKKGPNDGGVEPPVPEEVLPVPEEAPPPERFVPYQQVSMPPEPGVPLLPEGFKPLDQKTARRLRKAMPGQAGFLRAVFDEILALVDSGRYQAVLGSSVPPAEVLLTLLSRAGAWTRESQLSAKWDAYAQTQRQLVWHALLTELAPFKQVVEVVARRDPTLPRELTATMHFLRAKDVRAARGVATRKARQGSGDVEGAVMRVHKARVKTDALAAKAEALKAKAVAHRTLRDLGATGKPKG